MWQILALALLSAGLAGVPLLVSRRKFLWNPAFFVFLVVIWSLLLKSVYIILVHPRPVSSSYDPIYVDATSPNVFVAGAFVGLAAMCGYVGGYLLVGRRLLPVDISQAWTKRGSRLTSYRLLFGFSVACLVSFALYLALSGIGFWDLLLSEKRFQPADIGAPSRFHYPPYYFFKIATLSGPLVYGATLLLTQAHTLSRRRYYRSAVLLLFVFSAAVAHFASLRLVILLLLVQVLLLVAYYWQPSYLPLVASLVVVTGTSFVLITFIHRSLVPPAPDLVAELNPSAPPAPGSPAPAAEGGRDEVAPVPQVRRPAEDGAKERTNSMASEPRAALREEDEVTRGPGTLAGGRPEDSKAGPKTLRRWVGAALGGRYFMDVTKLSHVANHFPEERPFVAGRSLLGLAPEVGGPKWDADKGAQSLNRYLAVVVFQEPNNNIPAGFAGELYIGFGWIGLVVGFVVVGGAHRLLFNYLTRPDVPVLVVGCLIALIPNTTLVLLNSGLLAAGSRSVIDLGILLFVWPLSVRSSAT